MWSSSFPINRGTKDPRDRERGWRETGKREIKRDFGPPDRELTADASCARVSGMRENIRGLRLWLWNRARFKENLDAHFFSDDFLLASISGLATEINPRGFFSSFLLKCKKREYNSTVDKSLNSSLCYLQEGLHNEPRDIHYMLHFCILE